MNIFITGGAGYIGSATAPLLLEAGHSVTVFDSLVKGYQQAVPKSAKFIQADLADETLLTKRYPARNLMRSCTLQRSSKPARACATRANFSPIISTIPSTCWMPWSSMGSESWSSPPLLGSLLHLMNRLHEDSPKGPTSVYGQSKYHG